MAATMLNFGGKITTNAVGTTGNGSCIIKQNGQSDSQFALRSSRDDGSTIIIFSTILNYIADSGDYAKVNLFMVDNNSGIDKKVSVGNEITVVPGRPVSLDYKITMTANDLLYVTCEPANAVDIVISAVQM